MPRKARKNLESSFIHAMVQGINKEYIFSTKEQIEKYLEIINKNKSKYEITIIAYCIMNNHAHMLIYAENIWEIGKFMHIVNLLYSNYYNKMNNRVGVVFRNKYRCESINSLNYLINCINYIHMNPVKANIVEKCEQYPYSSFNDYKNNAGVCKSQIMIELFGQNYNYSEIILNDVEYLFIDANQHKTSEIYHIIDKRVS